MIRKGNQGPFQPVRTRNHNTQFGVSRGGRSPGSEAPVCVAVLSNIPWTRSQHPAGISLPTTSSRKRHHLGGSMTERATNREVRAGPHDGLGHQMPAIPGRASRVGAVHAESAASGSAPCLSGRLVARVPLLLTMQPSAVRPFTSIFVPPTPLCSGPATPSERFAPSGTRRRFGLKSS